MLTHATEVFKNILMNKISCFTKQYGITLCFMIICLAVVNPLAYSNDNLSEADLEQRVENLSSVVDMRYTTDVHKHIVNYTRSYKKGTAIILGRTSLYFPMFENILRDKGLPADLKYLSVIESSLRPNVTSSVGAAGLWQFMKGTGRMMGLKVNSTVDERRDPIKSTEAAAEYLKMLHSKFGDWTLALAAYNCGPGNVRKAIKKSGGKTTYWEIKKYLPRETRNYVPKFIAITYLMNYYYDHNISPTVPEEDLVNISSAQVYETVNLRKLSQKYNVSLAVIKLLNPAFIKNYIPANKNGRYLLTLPTDEMIDFVNNTQSATLLARAYSLKKQPVQTKTIKLEELPEVRELLLIDAVPTKIDAILTTAPMELENGKLSEPSVPVVKKTSVRTSNDHASTRLRMRESLTDVADRTGFTLEQLLEANSFSDENPLLVGTEISLPLIK